MYRTNSDIVPVQMTTGLVRANGAHCKCTPPNFLWRWWYSVQVGDSWHCDHGFGWTWVCRYNDNRHPFLWRGIK